MDLILYRKTKKGPVAGKSPLPPTVTFMRKQEAVAVDSGEYKGTTIEIVRKRRKKCQI